jgi:hypothetical protein
VVFQRRGAETFVHACSCWFFDGVGRF